MKQTFEEFLVESSDVAKLDELRSLMVNLFSDATPKKPLKLRLDSFEHLMKGSTKLMQALEGVGRLELNSKGYVEFYNALDRTYQANGKVLR
jgi:hypothetical protein